jgi:hypothetical protein
MDSSEIPVYGEQEQSAAFLSSLSCQRGAAVAESDPL